MNSSFVKVGQQFALAMSLCVVFANVANADGKLSRVRERVRNESHSTSKPSKQHTHDDDNDGGGVLAAIVGAVVSENNESSEPRPKKTKRKSKRRRGNRRSNIVHFSAPCPAPVYQSSYVHIVEPVIVEPVIVEPVLIGQSPLVQHVEPLPSPVSTSSISEAPILINQVGVDWFSEWAVRLDATGGTDFEDISNFGIGLLLQSPGGLGLDLSVTTLRESGMSFRDHLWVGDVNLVFEAVTTDRFRGRLGIGVNWLGDRIGGEAGFNLTSSFDWKLAERWVVTGEGDVGTLGSADFLHGEIGLTHLMGNAGIKTGYQYFDIGGVEVSGFFVGLECRF